MKMVKPRHNLSHLSEKFKTASIFALNSCLHNCVLVMIVTLAQITKQAKCEVYEFQKYALHESIVIALHFYVTSTVWVHSLAYYLFMPENRIKDLAWLP